MESDLVKQYSALKRSMGLPLRLLRRGVAPGAAVLDERLRPIQAQFRPGVLDPCRKQTNYGSVELALEDFSSDEELVRADGQATLPRHRGSTKKQPRPQMLGQDEPASPIEEDNIEKNVDMDSSAPVVPAKPRGNLQEEKQQVFKRLVHRSRSSEEILNISKAPTKKHVPENPTRTGADFARAEFKIPRGQPVIENSGVWFEGKDQPEPAPNSAQAEPNLSHTPNQEPNQEPNSAQAEPFLNKASSNLPQKLTINSNNELYKPRMAVTLTGVKLPSPDRAVDSLNSVPAQSEPPKPNPDGGVDSLMVPDSVPPQPQPQPEQPQPHEPAPSNHYRGLRPKDVVPSQASNASEKTSNFRAFVGALHRLNKTRFEPTTK